MTSFVSKFQYKIHLKRAIYILKQTDFELEHTFRINGYGISPTLLNIEIPFRTKILAVDIRLHYKTEHTISNKVLIITLLWKFLNSSESGKVVLKLRNLEGKGRKNK